MSGGGRSRGVLAGSALRRGSLATGAALVTGALAVLSGCGGSSESEPERSASVLPSYNTSCPERTGSTTLTGSVFNAVPGVDNLRIFVPQGSYDCYDWSGTSTPGRAFDGMEVGRGYPEPFRLETRGGPWTMETVFRVSGRDFRASVRLMASEKKEIYLRDGKTFAYKDTGWGEGDRKKVYSYPFTDLASAGFPDSSAEAVKEGCGSATKVDRVFGFGVYKGQLSVLFCGYPFVGGVPYG